VSLNANPHATLNASARKGRLHTVTRLPSKTTRSPPATAHLQQSDPSVTARSSSTASRSPPSALVDPRTLPVALSAAGTTVLDPATPGRGGHQLTIRPDCSGMSWLGVPAGVDRWERLME
jgi:hypothetical protein